MLVSIVIPCYNSEHSIKKTIELTAKEFKKLPGYDCEFVLVNDYSKDGTFASIKELCDKYSFVKGINLSRNFGQHNAIMAGLNYAEGDYIIGMDSANIRNIGRIVGNDRDGKVYKLLHFAGEERDIADPWYTGNFDATYDDVLKGCTALLNEILDTEKFTKEN